MFKLFGKSFFNSPVMTINLKPIPASSNGFLYLRLIVHILNSQKHNVKDNSFFLF